MSIVKVLAWLALLLAAPLQAAHARYAEGQVWAYHTRPGDEGSLLRIQRIEEGPAGIGPIYHISIIGFHLSNPAIIPQLPTRRCPSKRWI